MHACAQEPCVNGMAAGHCEESGSQEEGNGGEEHPDLLCSHLISGAARVSSQGSLFVLSARLNLLGTGQGTKGGELLGRLTENPGGTIVGSLPAMQEKQVMQFPSLGWENPG